MIEHTAPPIGIEGADPVWDVSVPEQADRSESSTTGKKWLKWLRPIVSAGLIGFLAWRTNWEQLGHAFSGMNPALWAGAFGLYVLSQVISAFRWQLLARPLEIDGSVTQFTGLYFIGMFFNLVLPTSVGGDVIRAWYLDSRSGRRMAAFLSVAIDRVSGLMILLLVACVAVVLYPFALPPLVTGSVWGMAGGLAVAFFLLPVLTRYLRLLDRLARLQQDVVAFLRRPRLLIGTTVLSFGVQAANVLLVWLLGLAIGVSIPAAYYWVFVPMVSLLTVLPISLNGMGVREGCTALFLAPLGVSADTAVCLALLWFTVLAAASLCGGVVYFVGYYPRSRGEAKHGSFGCDSHQGRAGQSRAAA
jgi:uncharacterized membrane protein YbhN (UPF0104 family)